MTELTVMVKVWGAEVSLPPLAVPPLSFRVTVTLATPLAFAAGVKVRVPAELMVGGVLKREGLSLVTRKMRVWLASSAGPGEMAVAQFGTVMDPGSSFRV